MLLLIVEFIIVYTMSFSQGKNLDHQQMRKFKNVQNGALEDRSVEAFNNRNDTKVFTLNELNVL